MDPSLPAIVKRDDRTVVIIARIARFVMRAERRKLSTLPVKTASVRTEYQTSFGCGITSGVPPIFVPRAIS